MKPQKKVKQSVWDLGETEIHILIPEARTEGNVADSHKVVEGRKNKAEVLEAWNTE